MGQSFFIWKGIDCRSKGIILRAPAPIIRAEERVKHIQIPGRVGDLTELEGTDIYNPYIQTVTISVKGGYRLRDIYQWLKGDGFVTFSGEPDLQQKARIIGAITLNRVSRNIDHWAGEVQFYCQPVKEKIFKRTVNLQGSNSLRMMNNGDLAERPLFQVTPNAESFSISVDGDGTPEENTISVNGVSSGETYFVDSETQRITDAEGREMTANSTGTFPVLGVGKNTISLTGSEDITIEQRERFL